MALRDAYDGQLRSWMAPQLRAGTIVERDGPLVRVSEPSGRGHVTYRSVAGVPDLDGLIARTRDHFAARGEAVEWKLHGHDLPADLPDRLIKVGFRPEERETVLIGLAEPLAAEAPPLPPGVQLREVTARADLDRIVAMQTAVWGSDHSFLAAALAGAIAADPTGITVVVAEAGDEVVSAGWVYYATGTAFATLWGGSTLPEWRSQGIYRALVAYRSWLARARGYLCLQVDASDDSRPILERCGFIAVTTTTPYVYRPS
jgi:GNAT superfamily N-acetyltransferase